MCRLKRVAIGVAAVVFAALIFAAVPFKNAEARYEIIFKLPKSYANKTQQRQFHRRVRREYSAGYQNHKSERVRGWHAYSRGLRKQDPETQLKAIYKQALTLVKFRTERKDVWSTPGETISRGFGDCDDYAHIFIVASYVAGFDLEKTWMVAGWVSAGGSKPIGHAIAVIGTRDGRQFVMDNLYGRVVSESEHKRFKPVYSINIGSQIFYAQVNTALAEAF